MNNNGTKDVLIRILLSVTLVLIGGIGALNQLQFDGLNKSLHQVWQKLESLESTYRSRDETLRRDLFMLSVEVEKLKTKYKDKHQE